METSHLTLVLTAEAASKLRGLLDVAVKAGGLQVAAVAVEIDALILAADQARQGEPNAAINPPGTVD